MQDIKYQLNKKTKLITNLKTIVPLEYHDFLDVFLKQASDELKLYSKYNHKIKILKNSKLSDLRHSAFCGISIPQLESVKKFLEEYLKKKFIEANSAHYSSLILLAKKPSRGVRFCVDY